MCNIQNEMDSKKDKKNKSLDIGRYQDQDGEQTDGQCRLLAQTGQQSKYECTEFVILKISKKIL